MKEKILKRKKVEIEETISQETICSNILSLSSALSELSEIDGNTYIGERFDELRINVLNTIYLLSTHLTTEEPI